MARAGCPTSREGLSLLSTAGIDARLQSPRLHQAGRAQLRPPRHHVSITGSRITERTLRGDTQRGGSHSPDGRSAHYPRLPLSTGEGLEPHAGGQGHLLRSGTLAHSPAPMAGACTHSTCGPWALVSLCVPPTL